MTRLLKYILLFVFFLSACTHYYAPQTTTASHSELKQAKEDSLSVVKIYPYKQQLDVQMNEVIAFSDSTLSKDGLESTLANFVMHAIDYFTEVNKPELTHKIVPMINRGGLRINIPKGEISIRTIYELMPFDNEIVYVTITGNNFYEAIKTFCENGKLFNNHVSFYIDKNTPLNIKILNENWNESAEYTVATTDYLVNGGDNSYFFVSPKKTETTGVKLRDAIIDYCKYLKANNKHILLYIDGRITVSK